MTAGAVVPLLSDACPAQTFTLLPPAFSGVALSADGQRGTLEPHSLWTSPDALTLLPLAFECLSVSPDGLWALGRDGLAARRSVDGVQESFSPVPDGYSLSYATASSGDNAVVFGYGTTLGDPPRLRAFRWTLADGTTDLGLLVGGGSDGTVALDCSNDGLTAVGYSSLNGSVVSACRWTAAGGVEALTDSLGAPVTGVASAISGDGEWIVGGTSWPQGAFRWTQAGLVQLLPAPDVQVWQTSSSDVSGDGQRVVGWGTPAGGQSQAIVWDGTGSASLLSDLLTRAGLTAHQGLLLATAESVSGDGRTISGLCFDFIEGEVHPYVATLPPPCPADIGRQGGLPGSDGVTDNNDFVVFIDYFFGADALADFGRQGGLRGPDGALDNNDFVVFIDWFFEGCGGGG